MIPAVLHFIWIQRTQLFDRLEYLSIKSALLNTPYKIILHTDALPSGSKYCPYSIHSDRFEIIYFQFPDSIQSISCKPSALSDYYRLVFCSQFGGIYSDIDILWFKPLPESVLQNNLFSAWENQPYRVVNSAIFGCAKDFDFASLFQELHQNLEKLPLTKHKDLSENNNFNHVYLYKIVSRWLRDNSDLILKRVCFFKNTYYKINKYCSGVITDKEVSFKDAIGYHVYGCGLWGKLKCDTRSVIDKHPFLKEIVKKLEP